MNKMYIWFPRSFLKSNAMFHEKKKKERKNIFNVIDFKINIELKLNLKGPNKLTEFG